MSDKYTIRAPEFPQGLEWLNVDKPLKISELKGKFVLLDFWTYCCINCMHIIPDLKKLEEKYAGELVVIGVHSAKFISEKSTDNIRQAILRYEIEHPVINDKDFKVWQAYAANSWPTLVLINPNGRVIGKMSGEGIYEPIDRTLQTEIASGEYQISKTHLALSLEKDKKPKTVLNFPGKILADEKGKRLFITDSNNNRIIITDLEGNIIDVIGSGEQGQTDGRFEEAKFFHPQGTALKGDVLYIADTENHLIRKADLLSRTVERIAGTGEQVYNRSPRGNAREVGLNSPWDLTIVDNTLYIAMAGPHQLWSLDIPTNNITAFAGSGREDIIDGDLTAAALAQPSGITYNDGKVYFADSEVSAVRYAETEGKGKVRTIIGEGLFEFGDVDGSYPEARLQHPLGIVFAQDKLYVADTYNNKIKIVDPVKKTSRTFAGTGKEGSEDGSSKSASFNEPGGITYAGGKLYLSDTNNHLIRVIDAATGEVSTLILKGIEKLNAKPSFDINDYHGEVVKVDGVNFDNLEKINFEVKLPEGYKINEVAESGVRIFTADGSLNLDAIFEDNSINQEIDAAAAETIYAEAVIYYCREGNEGLCMIKDVLFEIDNDPGSTSKEANIEIPLM
ncbi:MAG TPA: thioredoxin-like domain-containing protein [Ignavibacteriales bacterium]|nr:thioredoxin-like domain-containing protein [Ignavibacteriales bacterium]